LIGMGIQEDQDMARPAGKGLRRSCPELCYYQHISTLVSLVIAIVVIFIVIMIKTINNRRQIGILKAIGIHRTIITFSYVFQVTSSLSWHTIGLLILFAMNLYFSVYPIVFPDGDIRPAFTITDLAANAVLLFIASTIAVFAGMAYRTKDIMTAMKDDMIRVENLKKTYYLVLSKCRSAGITFEVKRGDFLGSWPSGSGKSTLLTSWAH